MVCDLKISKRHQGKVAGRKKVWKLHKAYVKSDSSSYINKCRQSSHNVSSVKGFEQRFTRDYRQQFGDGLKVQLKLEEQGG